MSIRRTYVEPVETPDSFGCMDSTRLDHPAFGCIVVSRVHVGGSEGRSGCRLFGSDLGHHSYMRLDVHEATMQRNLSQDRHYARKLVCSIEMSEAQWVQMIAAQGIGSGVPVTFAYRRTGDLLECPQIAAPKLTKAELHGAEMRKSLATALTDMSEVASQLAKMVGEPGAVSKTELKRLSELLSRRVHQAPGSVEFVHSQFERATEETIANAKAEIEAFVVGTAQNLGLEQMRLQAPAMPTVKQLEQS